MTLVTIIIPCYNYGWLLAETLDSVLAQTYSNWECIIVDDGSKDNTRAVAEKYVVRDNRFSYLYRENGGLSAARNTGIQNSNGEFLQLLDADDLIVPTKIESQVNFLNLHSEVDIVYGDVRYFPHELPAQLSRSLDLRDTPWITPLTGSGESVLVTLLNHNQLVVNAPLFKKQLISRAGKFREGLKAMEDWDFWLRCALAGACFHYAETPLTWALVRVHSNSMSKDSNKMYKCELTVRCSLNDTIKRSLSQQIVNLNDIKINFLSQTIGENASHQILSGSIAVGAREFAFLGQSTGNYLYYLKTAIYWLKLRIMRLRTRNIS